MAVQPGYYDHTVINKWVFIIYNYVTEEIQLHPYVYMNSTAQVCYCQVWQPWCFPNLKLEYLTNTLQLLYRDYRDYMKRPHMQLYISWLGHYLSRLCST